MFLPKACIRDLYWQRPRYTILRFNGKPGGRRRRIFPTIVRAGAVIVDRELGIF